ncbi:hypothetical protein [Halomicronema hongdechloris]|nr:hypothetical protein [Halomicronema hongdechloris]
MLAVVLTVPPTLLFGETRPLGLALGAVRWVGKAGSGCLDAWR